LNQEFFNKNLRYHKIAIGKLLFENEKVLNEGTIIYADKLAFELCIAYANGKCQKCESEDGLQLHHVISKHHKKFMPFMNYLSQRHYWANIVLLCKDCHKEIHEIVNYSRGENNGKVVERKIIDEIIKKYS
jgi:5-methylcytosine-specific restriction endonuclease McrA